MENKNKIIKEEWCKKLKSGQLDVGASISSKTLQERKDEFAAKVESEFGERKSKLFNLISK